MQRDPNVQITRQIGANVPITNCIRMFVIYLHVHFSVSFHVSHSFSFVRHAANDRSYSSRRREIHNHERRRVTSRHYYPTDFNAACSSPNAMEFFLLRRRCSLFERAFSAVPFLPHRDANCVNRVTRFHVHLAAVCKLLSRHCATVWLHRRESIWSIFIGRFYRNVGAVDQEIFASIAAK